MYTVNPFEFRKIGKVHFRLRLAAEQKFMFEVAIHPMINKKLVA